MKRRITPFIAAGAAKVSVASSALGLIAVDSNGRTLYLFEKDAGWDVLSPAGRKIESGD